MKGAWCAKEMDTVSIKNTKAAREATSRKIRRNIQDEDRMATVEGVYASSARDIIGTANEQ